MKRLVVTILLLFVSFTVCAQDTADVPSDPRVEKDDPVSLYSATLGDEELELLLQGSWRATASFGTGLRFGPGGAVVFPAAFSLFADGFYFEQVPDLTFTVSYADRFFLETTVLANASDNTILLGYNGQPGEFVQKVLIGNKDTRIGEYDFIDMPSQSVSSIGASAAFQSGFSSHELLLRFDSTREEKKVFTGIHEMSEKKYSPEQYLHGRFFMLPDSNVENLSVYLEDKTGAFSDTSGRRYRKANVQEIAQDAENGFLYILIEHKGRIAVHYTVGANTVGDAALGANALPAVSGGYINPDAGGTAFNWGVTWLGDVMATRQLSINSQTCLLLWEPGAFSPFEMCTAYDLGNPAPEDVSTVAIKLIPKGAPESSYSPGAPAYFRVEPGRTFFIVYADSSMRGNFRNHYPFPDTNHQLYGPIRDHIPVYTDYEIYAMVPTGSSVFSLASNVVPGSVKVRRNGEEETRFTINYTTGTVEFSTPIYPYDHVEIIYRVSVAEKNAGDLLFSWGNRFPIDPLFSIDCALGVRWNILPGAFTETAWTKTGALVLSSGIYGKTDNFSYRVAGALSYAHPDTTGILRLAGMEGNSIVIEPTEAYAYPSAIPGGIGVLNNRGRLLYKNYREYDAFGNPVLQPSTWTPPSSQVWDYADNSKPGPYLVLGNSSSSSHGESLALDFELDAAGDWAGFQIPVTVNNGTIDLSNVRAIITSMRVADVTGGSFDVYVQMGALGEDVDNDSNLDTELSPVSGGFQFNDSDNGVTMFVGGGPKNEGNNILNSEDVDGNGFLDGEDAGYIYSNQINGVAINTSGGWQLYSDNLSLIQQEALRKVRSLRVVVVAATPATAGRILIDKIDLSGTSVYSNTTGSITVNAHEVPEALTSVTPAVSLAKAFPEIDGIFHASGAGQEVLEINWNGGGAGDSWSVTKGLGAGSDGIHYKKLVLYVYNASTALDGPLQITAGDISGNNAVIAVNQSDVLTDMWQKIEITIDARSVNVNNVPIGAGATFTVDPGFSSIQKITIGAADASGTLLVDEIHLEEAWGRFGAAMSAEAELRQPGVLLSFGDFSAVSDFTISEKLIVKTDGFATLYSRPQEDLGIRSYSHMKVGLFLSDIEGDFTALASGDSWTFEGAHRLRVPNVSFPVTVTDSFTLRSRALGQQWSREDAVQVMLSKLFSFNLSGSAACQDTLLTQSWKSDVRIDALLPLFVSFSTSLGQSDDDFSSVPLWYGEAWVSGFQYLVPLNGSGPVSRNWTTTGSTEWRGDPFSVKLTCSSGYNSYTITDTAHTQKDLQTLILSVPVKLGDISFETKYSRTLASENTISETGSLDADYAGHFSRYPLHDYFFLSVPVYEIFSDDAAAAFRDRVNSLHRTSYKPELSFSFLRKFGSDPLNLIVPAKITAAYGREYVVEDLLFNAFETISVQMLFNAINVFGTKSPLKLIPFYEIDTFSTSFSASWLLRENRELASFLFSSEGAYTFETAGGGLFTVKNILNIQNTDYFKITEKGIVDFTWKITPKEGIQLPLLDAKIAETGYLSNKEGIEIQYAASNETISSHPVTLVLKHETAIQYPEFGYLRAEIAFGFDWQASPLQGYDENIYTTGLRLTLELNVNF